MNRYGHCYGNCIYCGAKHGEPHYYVSPPLALFRKWFWRLTQARRVQADVARVLFNQPPAGFAE